MNRTLFTFDSVMLRTTIHSLSLLFAAFLSVFAQAQTRGLLEVTLSDNQAPVTLYERSHALVIGIDKYSHGWPRLSNAVRDARAIAGQLTNSGFEVKLVIDPDSRGLRNAVEDFVYGPGANKNARLFIWFAGHGHTIGGEGYLVPSGAPGPAKRSRFRRAALSLRSFGRYMREIESKHVLAVFDSCFAGTIFNTARSLPPAAITRATTLPVRQFVTSGEAEQQVSDDGSFRKLFIDALTGEEPRADANADGYLTGSELGLFLSDKVTNFSEGRQTPRYGKLSVLGLDRGDFVFKLGAPAKERTSTGQCSAQQSERASRFWGEVKNTKNPVFLKRLIERFPACVQAELARVRLDELQAATTRTAPVSHPHDGLWSGSFCSHKTRRAPESCRKLLVTINGGVLVAEQGIPGKPGYVALSGKVKPSGDVTLFLKGIAGRQRVRGKRYAGTMRGKVRSNTLVGAGEYVSGRGVSIKLVRRDQ